MAKRLFSDIRDGQGFDRALNLERKRLGELLLLSIKSADAYLSKPMSLRSKTAIFQLYTCNKIPQEDQCNACARIAESSIAEVPHSVVCKVALYRYVPGQSPTDWGLTAS